jgi:hypothetical protein
MIRITVEIIPPLLSGVDGREIARAEIVNVGTGTKERGDYRYVLWGKLTKPWRTGEIKDFPRKSYNVWLLLFKVLKDALKK